MVELNGMAVSSGIAIGKALLMKERELVVEEYQLEEDQIENEVQLFRISIDVVIKEIEEYIRNFSLTKEDKAILETHVMILLDPDFHSEIERLIKEEKRNLEQAIHLHFSKIVHVFRRMENELYSDRATDYEDVEQKLLMHLKKIDYNIISEEIEGEIVVLNSLPPSLVSFLHHGKVAGIILTKGTKTSHSVIIAKAYGIPIVTGMQFKHKIHNDDLLIIDAKKGLVICNPTEEKLQFYNDLKNKLLQETNALNTVKELPSATADSQTISILNNIELPLEINTVLNLNSEGIGLFRTEFFYLNRPKLPEEEEQFLEYKALAKRLEQKPVVIRTIDVGGDKIGGLYAPVHEENPYLGCRGIRFSLKNKPIFKTQLRAILRASIYGNIHIMFPMVASVEEFLEAKECLVECKNELINQKIPFKDNIPIGTMIEIPSAALSSENLAKYSDFFSIGTNDLLQYTVAVDRNNQTVAHAYNPYNPAFLNLILLTINNAKKHHIPVSICGELASDLNFSAFLLNAGIRNFSVGVDHSLLIKKYMRTIDSRKGVYYLDQLKNCETAHDTRQFIERINSICVFDEKNGVT